MADVKTAIKDMVKQRHIQAVAGFFTLLGIGAWLLGYAPGQYLAAASIILFTVATLRWIDDEERLEKEHEPKN